MAEVAAAHNWRVNELGCVPGNRTGAETVACERNLEAILITWTPEFNSAVQIAKKFSTPHKAEGATGVFTARAWIESTR